MALACPAVRPLASAPVSSRMSTRIQTCSSLGGSGITSTPSLLLQGAQGSRVSPRRSPRPWSDPRASPATRLWAAAALHGRRDLGAGLGADFMALLGRRHPGAGLGAEGPALPGR